MTPRQLPPLPPAGPAGLPCAPPLVWPEPRYHAGHSVYPTHPPLQAVVAAADLVAGVLVGVADRTIRWLQELLDLPGPRHLQLVIVVFAAGPTREQHLLSLQMLQAQVTGDQRKLAVRVLPVARAYGHDYEQITLPPTVLQAHDSRAGKTTLCIGSVGDSGGDPVGGESFNVMLHPDDALRDSWRRWFQYLFCSAAPLTSETVRIPHLVPAKGDPAAAEMWRTFEDSCRRSGVDEELLPEVDPETGEVTAEPDGTEVKPWDEGKTALDPLAQKLQEVYARSWLVTVDENTRIKPLAIPVKATLLGQESERAVGAVTHRQSFTLQVLSETVAKEVEKCRKVTDLTDLLTHLLSLGCRLLPEGAKGLLENELKARSTKGRDKLKEALGGKSVSEFVKDRQDRIRKDLDKMYSELGKAETVSQEQLDKVLTEIDDRLTRALVGQIAPRAVYNRIAPPDLTANAPDENWAQPLSLLLRSARLIRESHTDAYFPRRLSGLSFKQETFLGAMDIFGDAFLKSGDLDRARRDLEKLARIEADAGKLKEKCAKVWKIISGDETWDGPLV